jgi:hypothetical protein
MPTVQRCNNAIVPADLHVAAVSAADSAVLYTDSSKIGLQRGHFCCSSHHKTLTSS